MIIVDLQQILIANLSRQLENNSAVLDENMLRHMVLNTIRAIRQTHKDKGELVIACDAGNSWRRRAFPYYKANRTEKRKNSLLDWESFFASFHKIRSELREFFPYRVIDVDGAEADDVIGVLCHEFGVDSSEFGGMVLGSSEPILIISGDHDFKQLQIYSNVTQFDPTRKKAVRVDDPASYLKQHIIKGDAGDGVPNFLSDDDCFVSKKRQKSIFEEKLEVWLKQPVEQICDTEAKLRNWKRNEQMVDLRFTPKEIKEEILRQYEEQAGKNSSKLTNYFIKNKLKHLHELINEF